MPPTSDILRWHHRFFGDDQEGHAEEDVREAEATLGCRLPAELRELQRSTYLRDSEMLHLEPIEGIRWDGDILVFAREQQDCWAWGIPRAEILKPSPKLVANPHGRWVDDGVTLGEWLRSFVLINRPYVPPCLPDVWELGNVEHFKKTWSAMPLHSASLGGHTLWFRGGASAELVGSDGVIVGAVSLPELKAALDSLGLTVGDDELDLVEENQADE